MPAATPMEIGVRDERHRMLRHKRDTPGHSPGRGEVPDWRARRADAAAGREGSLPAEGSSEKKVGSKAAAVLQARLLPSERLSAMFGGSCCQGTGSVGGGIMGASTSFACQIQPGASLGGRYGRMTARPLHATDWSTAATLQEWHSEPRLIDCCSLLLCCRNRRSLQHSTHALCPVCTLVHKWCCAAEEEGQRCPSDNSAAEAARRAGPGSAGAGATTSRATGQVGPHLHILASHRVWQAHAQLSRSFGVSHTHAQQPFWGAALQLHLGAWG